MDRKFIVSVAKKIFDIDNISVTLITKPYKEFVKSVIKLCTIFSLLAFVSFTSLMVLFLSAVYVVFIYINWIFISHCAKFGYKKIMCALVLSVLYFACYLAVLNVRSFIPFLFSLDIQWLFYIIVALSVLFFAFLLIFLVYSWGKVFKEQLMGFLMVRDYKKRRRNRK